MTTRTSLCLTIEILKVLYCPILMYIWLQKVSSCPGGLTETSMNLV